MGAAASGLFESTTHQIVLLGLDYAGKTTVLYRLKRQKMVLPTPTVGFNCEKIKVNHGAARGHTFVIWDIAGQESFRALWSTYLKNASALIFILDASDGSKFDEAKVELDNLLHSLSGQNKFPLIILANKQDKPEAALSEEILKTFTNNLKQKCFIETLSCCAVTGEGLENFFPVVLNAIQACKRGDTK